MASSISNSVPQFNSGLDPESVATLIPPGAV